MVLLTNKYKSLMSINDIEMTNGGGGGGSDVIAGGNSFVMTNTAQPSQLVGENVPTQQFDLSVISGLTANQKYRGNLVQDIQEAYQTYITGSPVGRGGKYALDAARRYGTTLTEAARGYLNAILPTLTNAPTITTGGGTTGGGIDLTQQVKDLQKQLTDIQNSVKSNDTIKILSDSIKDLFGNAVALQPLQSQATGYTPVTATSPLSFGQGEGGGGGSKISTFIILGIVGVVAYFLYKRFAS